MVEQQPDPTPSSPLDGATADDRTADGAKIDGDRADRATVAGGPHRPGPRRAWFALLVAVAVVLIGVLAMQGAPSLVGPGPSPSADDPASHPEPRIALIDGDGALVTRDRSGGVHVLAAEAGATYGFPAWSPDGLRIASVVDRTDATSIEVFPVGPISAAASSSPRPVVAFRSAASRPFYLYWKPDGRRVSFLAGETDGISLRVAPADGSGPPEGDPAGVLRRGSPLYYDWVASDHLLLHVGTGATAFVGEVGPGGAAAGPVLDGTGDYRPAVADVSGRYVAFVRGEPGSARVIAAHRDGSAEHELGILGPAAMSFDPTGATLAVIAAERPEQTGLTFPLGPIRLLDPEGGGVRTLLAGDGVAFFWSPDGRTIAALRLQAASGTTVAASKIVTAAVVPAVAGRGGTAAGPSASPGPTSGSELHLLFVNVADGAIRSDRIVRLTTEFVRQLLPYFDQYALSHRTWAPDSSSIVLPLLDDAGAGHLVVLPADGAATEQIPGSSGFWSP